MNKQGRKVEGRGAHPAGAAHALILDRGDCTHRAPVHTCWGIHFRVQKALLCGGLPAVHMIDEHGNISFQSGAALLLAWPHDASDAGCVCSSTSLAANATCMTSWVETTLDDKHR